MARPQEFNLQQVVSKAIECFWLKGYRGTSLADLLTAMNISRSSFYNSFGDKRQLFEMCLQTYSLRTEQILNMTLLIDKLPALEAIKQFFTLVLIIPDQELAEKGCLLVNTIAETAAADEELHQLAVKLMQPIKLGFIHQLNRQFDEKSSIRHGEWLVTQLLGWRLQSQMGLSKQQLEQQINWALTQLGR
jgi:TetR/AcrR family transcriptional repressor of nem operon